MALAALAAWSALAGPWPARAQEVPDLTGEVTDEVGALAGEEARVREALAVVREREGVHLFALFTDTTSGVPVTEFSDEVAAANSLGGDDALLVVALDDRSYALWVSDALTGVSDAEVDSLLASEVEPRLAAGDYADAVVAAAEELGQAAGTEDGEEPSERAGGIPWLALLLLAGGVVLLGSVVAGRVQRRRDQRRAAEERDRRLRQLARDANALLLASDEAVREAAQELDFAEAQFRPADVEPFRAALGRARAELHAAFAARQRLDDHVPETPEEREALLRDVVARAERVDDLLAAEHARLDELRDLERNAGDVLAALPAELRALSERADAAEGALERLRKVAPRSTTSVDGNLVEARKGLAAAHAAARAAQAALDAGARSAAANRIRDAQDALAQARRLVEAVEHLAADAAEAERDLDAELRAAGANVDAAAAAGEVHAQGLDAQLVEARRLLEQARAEAAAGERDVVEAYRLAAGASAAAGEVLAAARAAGERRARERTAAEKALRAAEVAHTRAADYLGTRRRGIGPRARTRLQEAERHLERARAGLDEDAHAAAADARTAERLADEAYRLAQRDFEGYDRDRGPFGRGPFGGGWGRRGPTIIIGGFPIPIGGSPRGGGGWGGSTWGSPGGGRARGGGFGGGRSWGGGFGGGGSRGGRF